MAAASGLAASAVSLHGLATQWMSDGALAWVGLALEAAVAYLYVRAARRPSPRGKTWPRRRTAAFVSGLGVIAVSLQSGLAAFDDTFWVHNLQHVLLMMVAPPLLALGAPITLALRSTAGAGRRRLVGVLHDPSVRSMMTRPTVLLLDYNLTMAVYLLTPLYRLSLEHVWLHVLTHSYFILCGLLFWLPVAGLDPVPGRLALRRRLALAAAAIPINAAIALAAYERLAPASGALSLLVAGSVASCGGVLLVALVARSQTRRVSPSAVPFARSLREELDAGRRLSAGVR